MLFKTFSAAVFGIDAYLVEVEVAESKRLLDVAEGAEAVAVFLVTGSDVEISYFWNRSGDAAPTARSPRGRKGRVGPRA